MINKEEYNAWNDDDIREGYKLNLERCVHVNLDADISALVKKGVEELERLREKSASCEREVFERLQAIAESWEAHAAETKLYDRALEYLNTPEVEHTGNVWVKYRSDRERISNERISNRVYEMLVDIYEETEYDREEKRSVPVAWYVTWGVRLNSPAHYNRPVAGQEHKRFKDRDAAMKYVEGRKKAYAPLFKELSPPIPGEYKESFSVSGLLLPGYTVKEEA